MTGSASVGSILQSNLCGEFATSDVQQCPNGPRVEMLLGLLPALTLALPAMALNCAASDFTAALASVPGATLNFAQRVAANGSFGTGAGNLAFPVNATGLPALCAVGVNIRSSSNSSYNFGLFLPDTYNSRFLATGNGGYGGGINWVELGKFAHYGFATVATDTGHLSVATDGTWGYKAPETLIDWGYRAMHGSVATAKVLVKAYYKSCDIKYSYYASCSTGGRQGLRDIQLYPDDFDGIAVGAPAWWSTHLPASTLKYVLYNLPDQGPSYVPASLMPGIAAEMVRQCDPQDGLKDGIVSDPFGCNFNFEALLCRPGANSTGCLTPAQLHTVYQAYSDFVDVNQTFVFPSIALGTDPTFLLSAASSPGGGTLGIDYYKYWVREDPNWNYRDFTYADIQLADKIDPGNATADDFDLSPFHAKGGKVLHYHGSADNLIPTGSSLYFYNQVYKAMVPSGKVTELDEFYRMFFVPGMGHCSGSSNAPWYFGAGSQSLNGATHGVPGFEDAEHDIILALMKWVEEDKAPEHIIATKYKNDTAGLGVQLQRPLCVYPKQAKFDGKGDPNNPESWSCQSLY